MSTYDIPYLVDGFQLVIVGLGIYAVPEIVSLLRQDRAIAEGGTLGDGWAQGEGEYLRAFGAILGVRPGDHSRFSQTIQAHYPALLSAAGAKGSFSLDQFLERIHRLKPIWTSA